MLDAVPELDARGEATLPFTVVADDAPAHAPIRPVPYPLGGAAEAHAAPAPAWSAAPSALDAPDPGIDLHGLVGDVRENVRAAFDAQLARVEAGFGPMLERMEAKLAQAELELAAVRAEHERVKTETARKADALRELKKTLENI